MLCNYVCKEFCTLMNELQYNIIRSVVPLLHWKLKLDVESAKLLVIPCNTFFSFAEYSMARIGYSFRLKSVIVLIFTWFSLPSCCDGDPCAAINARGVRTAGSLKPGTGTVQKTKDSSITLSVSICLIKNGNPCIGFLDGDFKTLWDKDDYEAFTEPIPDEHGATTDLLGTYSSELERMEAAENVLRFGLPRFRDFFCESGTCELPASGKLSATCKNGTASSKPLNLYQIQEYVKTFNNARVFEPIPFKVLAILAIGFGITLMQYLRYFKPFFWNRIRKSKYEQMKLV